MGCPSNKKKREIKFFGKVLFSWEYEAPHEWRIFHAEKLLFWSLEKECKICKCGESPFGYNDEDMVRMGLMKDGKLDLSSQDK